ncbi:MAG: geranylgeranyl reductase family protein [Spirochaetes bacterium]|nr:geranylgeranyl reductase family protein [Spirochaetota bacterium]
MKRFDVIVVGGGPAGAIAAMHCGGRGLETLLLEKARLPRYKPCAGGLTAAASRELGFELDGTVVERSCSGVRIRIRGEYRTVTADGPVFYTVRRELFDENLCRKAADSGTVLHDGEGISDLRRDGRKTVVTTNIDRYLADIVIGADGFHSLVRRSLGVKFTRDEIKFCVLCEVPVPEEMVNSRFGDMLQVDYDYVDGGYAWIFPKRESVTCGIGGALSDSKSFPDKLRRFLHMNGLDTGVRIKGGFLPTTRFRQPVYGDGVMLAGDAAGFVDAFTGEGIRFAIISGKLAAKTAQECHERGDFSQEAFSVYQSCCENAFGGDLVYAARITDLFSRFSEFVKSTIVKHSGLLKGYLKTMTGEMDYRTFFESIKRRIPLVVLKRLLLLQPEAEDTPA